MIGEWKQTNGTEDSYQYATINSNVIEIYWITDGTDTKSLYWYGSFELPKTSNLPYTCVSVNDHTKTQSSLLVSDDDTKEFMYDNGELTYSASMLGTTKTIRMKKVKELNASADSSNNNSKPSESTEGSNSSNSKEPESEKFNIIANINCEIIDNEIYIKVSNTTATYSLIKAFTIPSNYEWKLYDNVECTNGAISSKTVSLAKGDNVFYALFENKNNSDDIYLYKIKIYRTIILDLKIVYFGDVDTVIDTIKIEYGTKIKDIVVNKLPTFAGYHFAGYSYYSNSDILAEDEIIKQDRLYARYKEDTYKVNFYDNNKKLLYSTTTNYGGNVIYKGPEINDFYIENTYYKYYGWDKNTNKVTTDLNVYAKYEIIELTSKFYSIDFSDIYSTGNARIIDIPSTIDGYSIRAIGTSYSSMRIFGHWYGVSRLAEYVTLPTSITTIWAYSFLGSDENGIVDTKQYSSLKEISITNSILEIDPLAFYHCDSLEKINYQGTMEDWNEKFNNYKTWFDSNLKIKIVCTNGIIEINY